MFFTIAVQCLDCEHTIPATKCLTTLRDCHASLETHAQTLSQYADINRAMARDAAAAGCETLRQQKDKAAATESEIARRIFVLLGSQPVSREDAEREASIRESLLATRISPPKPRPELPFATPLPARRADDRACGGGGAEANIEVLCCVLEG